MSAPKRKIHIPSARSTITLNHLVGENWDFKTEVIPIVLMGYLDPIKGTIVQVAPTSVIGPTTPTRPSAVDQDTSTTTWTNLLGVSNGDSQILFTGQGALNDLLGVAAALFGWNPSTSVRNQVILDATNRLSNHPYDRNPTIVLKVYDAGAIGPHAATQRWTYTVPANRKAIVTTMFVRNTRQTAAAPASASSAWINHNSNKIVASLILTNNVGDKDVMFGSGPTMLAGDTLDGNTVDFSTGGTFDYKVAADILEFDA